MICVCGNDRFIGHQLIRSDVYVDADGAFEDNLPGGLDANIYDAEKPYGPFTCTCCGKEYEKLGKE